MENPTAGNWWLTDRDGQWILATQGSENDRAAGLDDVLPDFGKDWKATPSGGSHGYGCACLSVTADPVTKQVTTLHGARVLPLGRCQADSALPRPGR